VKKEGVANHLRWDRAPLNKNYLGLLPTLSTLRLGLRYRNVDLL